MLNFKPNISRSYLPRSFSMIYLVIFGAGFIALYLLKLQIPSILVLAIGFLGYVLLDMLASLRYAPPKKLGRKILAVFTCCFSAIALCAMTVVFIKYISA